MAKDNSGFFKVKKPWSEVKDELLACYLTPYFQKTLTTRKPVEYIDGFAGRGEFEDGKPGSPLIAINAARGCVERALTANTDLRLTFVEAQFGVELERIVKTAAQICRPVVRHRVVSGRFERKAPGLVAAMAGRNVFLYIDPYGIRDLDYKLITGFADSERKLNSIELLINLNSFGFIRAGCRALKVRFEDDAALRDVDDEFADAISQDGAAGAGPVGLLNSIAGGDYWRPIIEALSDRRIDGYEAERRFAAGYQTQLRQTYRYVLSMPIRLADGQQPKYRMVHATNHPDGCILMADNMMKRRQNLYTHLAGYGQPALFEQSVEGDTTDASAVRAGVDALVQRLSGWTDSRQVVADFFVTQGVICKSGDIHKALGQLESEGLIDVLREPAFTPTGKPSRFFDSGSDHRVQIRQK